MLLPGHPDGVTMYEQKEKEEEKILKAPWRRQSRRGGGGGHYGLPSYANLKQKL